MERKECHTRVPWGLSSTMDVTSSVFQACLPPPPWWHVSRCYLYCAASFDIDALLWHEGKFPGTTICRDGPGERCGEKCSEKCGEKCGENAAKNAVKNSTAEKQLFGIYHDCFHFVPGTLLATRFLDPVPQRSGSVVGSPSAQCNPLSNVMRLNVLQDFIHSTRRAALIKTGTYHDMR